MATHLTQDQIITALGRVESLTHFADRNGLAWRTLYRLTEPDPPTLRLPTREAISEAIKRDGYHRANYKPKPREKRIRLSMDIPTAKQVVAAFPQFAGQLEKRGLA